MAFSVWRFNTICYTPPKKPKDKNNRKFKILYKFIKASTSAIWQHMLHIPPTKDSPKRSNNKPTRATQKSLPFGKWRFREKEVGEKKDKTERATGLVEEQKRRLESSDIIGTWF